MHNASVYTPLPVKVTKAQDMLNFDSMPVGGYFYWIGRPLAYLPKPAEGYGYAFLKLSEDASRELSSGVVFAIPPEVGVNPFQKEQHHERIEHCLSVPDSDQRHL